MSEIFGVVGAGTMGNGIAQTAANAGYEVVMCDVQEDFVKKEFSTIEKSLDRFVKKETMTEEQKQEVLGRIRTTAKYAKHAKRKMMKVKSFPSLFLSRL